MLYVLHLCSFLFSFFGVLPHLLSGVVCFHIAGARAQVLKSDWLEQESITRLNSARCILLVQSEAEPLL